MYTHAMSLHIFSRLDGNYEDLRPIEFSLLVQNLTILFCLVFLEDHPVCI